MRKIYITEQQLEELIDTSLMMSTETTPDYEGSTISTTEPVGDGENYGIPPTSDDKARNMPPGLFQRMTSKGVYGGPMV
jgi:hypothetical protein